MHTLLKQPSLTVGLGARGILDGLVVPVLRFAGRLLPNGLRVGEPHEVRVALLVTRALDVVHRVPSPLKLRALAPGLATRRVFEPVVVRSLELGSLLRVLSMHVWV